LAQGGSFIDGFVSNAVGAVAGLGSESIFGPAGAGGSQGFFGRTAVKCHNKSNSFHSLQKLTKSKTPAPNGNISHCALNYSPVKVVGDAVSFNGVWSWVYEEVCFGLRERSGLGCSQCRCGWCS
jgi:hypothetical protein